MKTMPVFKDDAARKALLGEYEAVLGRWPLPVERMRVPTSLGETAVLAFGPGGDAAAADAAAATAAGARQGPPPLFLLHGTGSNASMWAGEAAILARGRRVFAIDIPGEPGMSVDAKVDWQGAGAAAWLGEVVAALAPRQAHDVCGLSIGGWIGLAYAIGRPAGLGSLALLCPSGIGRTRASFTWKAVFSMMRGEAGYEAITRSLYGDEEPHPEALRISSLMARSTNPRMESPRIFADEELRGIGARVFLAVGTKDALLHSEESAARLSALKPEARVLVLEGRGHALVGMGEEVARFLDGR